MIRFFISILLSLLPVVYAMAENSTTRREIDLSGEWDFFLLQAPDTIADRGKLTLPGTLDTNRVGIPVGKTDDTSQLARRFKYTGSATYSRSVTIPESERGRHLTLFLERTRPATVAVDGVEIGYHNSVSAPQRYDLSEALTPGTHTIEITVDNGEAIPLAVRNNSHACAEATQTNWNGILGEIKIISSDKMHINDIHISAEAASRTFEITGSVCNPEAGGEAILSAFHGYDTATVRIPQGDEAQFSLSLPISGSVPLWSEWTPEMIELDFTLTDNKGNLRDATSRKTGLRTFSTTGTSFSINGNPTFLRGRHDACVWPMTAHVPTDIESWRRYFETVKAYGLNHVRFHSWCPPEACFAAADEAGVYLQPELPIWGEIDKDQRHLMEFLDEEMYSILREYSHHPSFVMFAIGNELWGDTSIMKDFIDRAREASPGLLATYGSNIYLGINGHNEGEDYLTTCRVGEGDGFSTHARASFSFADADNGGIINSVPPNSKMDFSGAIALSPVPVIGHETGQYQIYPDFSTISKYTGVLRPDNLEEFKRRAEEAGTIRKSEKYLKASGEWAAKLYRADMEMNLRTPGMGGFQLLDLQDYPGQGTALVGILDPFLDSKGVISRDDWRKSCSETVVLALFPDFSFASGAQVEIPLAIANYSRKPLGGTTIDWRIEKESGSTPVRGNFGVCDGGKIKLTLPRTDRPQKMTLHLEADNGFVKNDYDFWIYPEKTKNVKGVTVTSDIDEALALLEKGGSVILHPDSATVAEATLGPLFMTDYWNYRMFRTICDNVNRTPSPGTLGLLIDNKHPALASFPTDTHTDWQWFPIVSNSYPLIIDRLPQSVDPIVEPIDNVERNYRLALMFECLVGKGHLLVIAADMDKAAKRPEGRWMMQSVLEYMASKKPETNLTLTPTQVKDVLTKPSVARQIKELNNASYH